MSGNVGGHELKSHGALAYIDTGAPEGVDAYPTLVISHGYAWHSGAFATLPPLANSHNCRLVLINRTDYPGAKVIDADELKLLDKDRSDSVDAFQEFFKHRAGELVEFLAWFVEEHKIPKAGGDGPGGVTLTTWSFGNYLLLALLAYLSELDAENVGTLKPYVRCLQIYDPPHHIFGYTEHPDIYHPLTAIADPAEAAKSFILWVSAYWAHPSIDVDDATSPPQVEFRNYLLSPPPTITNMSLDQIAAAASPASVAPDKADAILYHAATGWNKPAYARMKDKALLKDNVGAVWGQVEVRWVWCEQSVGEAPWAVWNVKKDLAKTTEAGQYARKVNFVKVDGANHFYHWDKPAEAFATLLGT